MRRNFRSRCRLAPVFQPTASPLTVQKSPSKKDNIQVVKSPDKPAVEPKKEKETKEKESKKKAAQTPTNGQPPAKKRIEPMLMEQDLDGWVYKKPKGAPADLLSNLTYKKRFMKQTGRKLLVFEKQTSDKPKYTIDLDAVVAVEFLQNPALGFSIATPDETLVFKAENILAQTIWVEGLRSTIYTTEPDPEPKKELPVAPGPNPTPAAPPATAPLVTPIAPPASRPIPVPPPSRTTSLASIPDPLPDEKSTDGTAKEGSTLTNRRPIPLPPAPGTTPSLRDARNAKGSESSSRQLMLVILLLALLLAAAGTYVVTQRPDLIPAQLGGRSARSGGIFG